MRYNKALVWAVIVWILQLLNAAAGAFAYLGETLPEEQKLKALAVNGFIGVLLGTWQAFSKKLPDGDGDGIPDLFDSDPGPSEREL